MASSAPQKFMKPDLDNNQLLKFIAASGMSNLADGVAVVVWAWLASLLSRDPLYIALMPIALRLPWFLFALPAGIVTDRSNRRSLILCMDLVRSAAFMGAGFAIWVSLPLAVPPESGTANPILFTLLLGCAMLVGVAEVFRDNAAQTILPAMVPHDQLERVNGRLWSVELVGNSLLGPALGAFLIATLIWIPFAFNALAFLIAVVLVLDIRGNFNPVRSQNTDWQEELKQGLAFVKNAPLLKMLAGITGVWNLLHQMVVIALILHVQENLELKATGYGLILATGALGGIAGGFLAERVIKKMGPGATARWMTFASAVAFAAIPFAPNGIVLALVFAAFEFTGLVWNTVSVSYRQRTIPDELLGRVNSIYRLLAWGMMPIGLLLSGILVSWSESMIPREIALKLPFYVAALGATILTVIVWRPLGTGFAQAKS